MARKLTREHDPSELPRADIVHARQLLCFAELVQELGGEPRALIEAAGVDATMVLEQSTATYGEIALLLEAAASELGCPDFGMMLAVRQGGTDMFGPAGRTMRNASTFGEAIEFVAAHSYAHSLAAVIWTRRFPQSAQFAVGHTLLVEGPLIRTQMIEQIFMLGRLLALNLTRGHVRPRLVLFRHQPVSPLQTYRRYFGCEVLFGQSVDVLVYNDHSLEMPLVESDDGAYRCALAEIEARRRTNDPFLRSRARAIISHFLSTEFCTRGFLASRLKLHPRTMDRRLAAQGTSFLELRAEVRRDLLRYYAEETGFDFASISERLGFSEQSALTRSCRKWFGLTPSQLRAQAGASRPLRRSSSNGPPDLVFDPMR